MLVGHHLLLGLLPLIDPILNECLFVQFLFVFDNHDAQYVLVNLGDGTHSVAYYFLKVNGAFAALVESSDSVFDVLDLRVLWRVGSFHVFTLALGCAL